MPAIRKTLILCLVVLAHFAAMPKWASASDQPDVQTRFEAFCKEWLQIVNAYAAKKMVYRKAGRGGYVAEYTGCSDTFTTTVKNADPKKKTYVGILSYSEVKLQNEGLTPEAAKKGPFYTVSQSPVKAIFMYRNGQWQN